jgi:regulator of PEP synthase PpsR (kinase-PPPase family)
LSADLQADIIEAFRSQFPSRALAVRVEPFVQTKERLTEILSRARSERAAICHVFMSAKLRKTIAAYCDRYELPCLDLVGALFEFLSALRIQNSTPAALRQRGRVTRSASNMVAGDD